MFEKIGVRSYFSIEIMMAKGNTDVVSCNFTTYVGPKSIYLRSSERCSFLFLTAGCDIRSSSFSRTREATNCGPKFCVGKRKNYGENKMALIPACPWHEQLVFTHTRPYTRH